MKKKRTKTEVVKGIKVDPSYRQKMKASLRHTHRQVIRFNDPEMAAIGEFCRRYGVPSKGPAFRKIIMEAVLKGLDATQPTLF